MIRSLYIRNYVLIDQLEMHFSEGFTTITGETGAGKSILMGALGLILGNRVDTSVLKLKSAKCIVEGTFHPDQEVRAVFEKNDLDFEPVTMIRREITPAGKSRAFINDTPVNLQILKEVGSRMVDIHSQHHNLQLNDHLYQLEVIDHFSGVAPRLSTYRNLYEHYVALTRKLQLVREDTSRLKEELDFMQHQYGELKAAGLKEGEMEILEENLQHAEHAEEIRHVFFHAVDELSEESTGILDRLKEVSRQLNKISAYSGAARQLAERLEAVYIELKDMGDEVYQQAEKADIEPGRLEQLQERVNLLYSLMQKHRVKELEALIGIRDHLQDKLEELVISGETIENLEKERNKVITELTVSAEGLHQVRSEAAGEMQGKVVELLKQLGIPNARFAIQIERLKEFGTHGKDDIRFLFSANKQVSLEEISRVASGGEISRLMLCIKSLVSDRKGMPTLIFDEIDAGVGGEIADKVGVIMAGLAEARQVMAITHLPQVASRGSDHFVVYKEDTEDATFTRIKKLDQEERVSEIARMLSGTEVTDAALSNARVLLRV
jgi:DNA repair protein RecN (Recombination protein N)